MSNQLEVIENTRNFLAQSWGVEEILEVQISDEEKSHSELTAKIARIVDYLIEKDLERLFWLLYRIDVSEQKVKTILDITGPDNASETLAKMIIEREIEKAKSRLAFKNKRDPKDDLDPEKW